MMLGVLDVGSTAARLELVELGQQRLPLPVRSFKAKTKLGENTGADGVVTPAGIEQAMRAVRKCAQAGGEPLPRSIVAFGTSAVRDAANADELRARLSEAAGVRIRALSPHGEAALTYHAARRWHGHEDAKLTSVDIGGGTIDVCTGNGSYPDEATSLPIGAALLTRRYLHDDPPSSGQVEQMTAAIREATSTELTRYRDHDLGHTVAQSKVLRQLAVLAESSEQRAVRHPDRLRRANLRRWIPRLAELDQKQRSLLPGVSRPRARRILAGAVVADAILGAIDVDTLEICPWGLREGLVFRFVEAYESAEHRARGDAVRAVMDEMFT